MACHAWSPIYLKLGTYVQFDDLWWKMAPNFFVMCRLLWKRAAIFSRQNQPFSGPKINIFLIHPAKFPMRLDRFSWLEYEVYYINEILNSEKKYFLFLIGQYWQMSKGGNFDFSKVIFWHFLRAYSTLMHPCGIKI